MKRAIVLTVLCVVMAGCAGPEISGVLQMAQYGTSTFGRTTLESVIASPFDDVVAAVRRTVLGLGLRPNDDQPSDGFLYLQLEDESGGEVTIRARRLGHTLTSLSIKVGLLGDEAYSNTLRQSIIERLMAAKAHAPVVQKGSTAGPR